MQNKIIFVDFNTSDIIDSEGAAVTSIPSITFGTQPNWEIHFAYPVSGSLAQADVHTASSWRAAIDIDYDSTTLPMVRVLSSSIDSTQAASGVLLVSLDANTQSFYTKMNGKDKLQATFEIRGTDSSSKTIYDYKFKVNCLGAIDPQGGGALPPYTPQ